MIAVRFFYFSSSSHPRRQCRHLALLLFAMLFLIRLLHS
jgi:hypothetical protein